MRLAQLLHHACHQENRESIRALYRQLLKREPEEWEIAKEWNSLEQGVPKHEIILNLVTSEEALQLYNRQSVGLSGTVADKLQFILSMDHRMVVVFLYAEILCRCVDGDGYESHLNSLSQGATPLEVLSVFLSCEEWIHLLQSDVSFMERKLR